MNKHLEQDFSRFHQLLLDNKVSNTVLSAFEELREVTASSLRRMSDFIAPTKEVQEITRTCSTQNAFGVFLNPFTPTSAELTPEFVALSLGRELRFCNQITLSVAEHCVTMAVYLEEKYPERPELAKWAMFHELGEVTLGDTPTPVKDILTGIRDGENVLLKRFARENGFVEEMPHEVHLLDKQMMITEALKYMPNELYWRKTAVDMGNALFGAPLEILDEKILRDEPLPANEAIELFAQKWIDLGLPQSVALNKMAQGDIFGAIAHGRELNDISRIDESVDSFLKDERVRSEDVLCLQQEELL